MTSVYLTDFGLAKATSTGSKYTRTGQAIGTPAYMSPEQARGETTGLTPATDVWALGAVLHELLAGRRAFEGDTPAAVIAAVLTAVPSPLTGVPRGVREFVAACLQRDPALRPRDGRAVAEDCARLLAGGRPIARPSRGRAGLVVGAGLVAVGCALVAVLGIPGPTAPAPPAEASPAEVLAREALAARPLTPAAAAERLDRALAAAPGRHDWRLTRGLWRWLDGDAAGARETWAAIPDGTPPSYAARRWDLVVRVLVPAETPGELGRVVLDLVGAPPGDARLGHALTAAARGDVAAVEAHLGGDRGWEAALIRIYAHNRSAVPDPEAARRAYDDAVEAGAGGAWARLNRGALRHARGDYHGAGEDYDAVVAVWPGQPDAHYNRGNVRAGRGDFAGALEDYAIALQGRPGFVQVWRHRARVRLEQGRPREALEDLTVAEQLAPRDAKVRFDRGRALEALGEPDAAEAAYTASLDLDPGYAPSWINRALLRRARGDRAGARADLDAAAAAQPPKADAFANRGSVRLEEGDLAGAETDFAAALVIEPAHVAARLGAASLRQMRGDLDGARTAFEEVARLAPELAEVHANLGVLHLQRESYAEAAAALERFLALAPAHPRAAEMARYLAAARARLPAPR